MRVTIKLETAEISASDIKIFAALAGLSASEAEPVKAEPVKAEPVKAEPVKAEPVKAEPVKGASVDAERKRAIVIASKMIQTSPEERAKVKQALTAVGAEKVSALKSLRQITEFIGLLTEDSEDESLV